MAEKQNYIGIAMGLDVSDLKSGLQETKKEITKANKTFQNETAGMDKWSDNVEGLQAKLKQLGEVLTQQKKNYAGISAELDNAKKKYGENSEQVRRLSSQLLDCDTQIKKLEKAHSNYSDKLQEVERETTGLRGATNKLKNALKDTEDQTDKLKGGFTVLKGAVANLVSSGINALVSGLSNAVTESQEFRRELSFLEQGAEDAGVSFEKAKDKVKEVYSVFGEEDSAVEGLNNLMTAGFDGAALDKITEQLTGASIKWKDTLKFEGLADGLQETLATGTAIGPFVELLERGGIVAEDFNAGLAAASTEAEKQAYVLDTLSSLGLEGIAQGYKDANKSLIENAEAQFEYNQTMGEVGEKVEPVFTEIKQGWADVLKAALLAADGIDLEALRTGIQNAFQWFIDTAMPKIREFVDFVMANKTPILATVGAIGAAFLAWNVVSMITGVITTIQTLITVLPVLKTAITAVNTAMRANPIGIIITLIGGLVLAFVTLWQESETFRNFWIGLWNKIKAVVQPVITYIGQAFSNTWNAIKKVWSVVADWFKGVWNKIKSIFSSNTVKQGIASPFSNAWKAIKTIWDAVVGYFKLIWSNIKSVFSVVQSVLSGDFRGAWNGIKSIWNNTKSYFSGIVKNILGYFGDLPDKFISVGKDMINGLIQGVKNAAGKLATAAKNAVKDAVNAAKKFLGIHSPSTLMRDEIGIPMGQGIGEGILYSTKIINDDLKELADSLDTELDTNIDVPIDEPDCDSLCEPVITAWDMIKNTWDDAPAYFENIWKSIRGVFSAVPNYLCECFEEALSSIESLLSEGFSSGLSDSIKEFESNLVDSMKNIVTATNEAIAKILELQALDDKTSNKKPFISEIPDSVPRNDEGAIIGQGISQGIITGVEESSGGIIDSVVEFGNNLINGVKDFFGINSPSKVFAEQIGVPLAQGISAGLMSQSRAIASDVAAFTGNLTANAANVAAGSSISSTGNAGVGGNISYTQIINAPKTPKRIDIYRDTRNLLSLRGGY